jgi:hypothetical protein
MGNAQVAVADYWPDWWPANTFLLIRRGRLDPGQVSADLRSRRRRALHPGKRALPIAELEKDWQRLSNSWRPRIDAQIAMLERLRDRLGG